MSDPIEDFCRKQILNTSLFKDNSSKFLDPDFDIKSFLCDVLKVTDMPNISPILKEEKPPFYQEKTDYSGLLDVGDPRVSLGLTLSAGFTNFMPRNIVYSETLKYRGTQVINNIVCDSDGNPIKVPVDPNGTKERELQVTSILNSEEVKDTYPNYDFFNTITLDQPPLQIEDLDESIDQIDLESLPTVVPHSEEHQDIFVNDSSLDFLTQPLDFNSLFIQTTPDEYKNFTKDFINYGKEQHTMYFVAFLNKFFISRGCVATIFESQFPTVFFVKIKQRIRTSINRDFTYTCSYDNNKPVGPFKYTSNIRYIYFKYWYDQIENVSKHLKITQKTVNTSKELTTTSNGMARALADPIADYKRIMKNKKRQKQFYKYSRKHYSEIPVYLDTSTYTDNPPTTRFVF
jgi:hypothetical protein